MNRLTKLLLTSLTLLVLSACGGGGGNDGSNIVECGAGPLLTVSPVDINDVHSFVPMGNLNPPAHTFPSDHGGFYIATPTDVVMPGDAWITQIIEQTATDSLGNVFFDYAITLKPCKQYKVIIGHVSTIISDLVDAISLINGSCEEYSTGGLDIKQCRYNMERFYSGGTRIGITTGLTGFDFGAFDYRQPPLQWIGQSYITQKDYGLPYSACLKDEYDATAWALISSVNPRTIPPLCGKIDLDVAGTAQGIWFREGISTLYPEDPHLALVYDYIDPSRAAISIGISLPTATGVHYFTPVVTGDLERRFDTITPGTTVYCYKPVSGGQLLLQLPVDRRLLLEHQSGSACTTPPFIMSNNAIVFVR